MFLDGYHGIEWWMCCVVLWWNWDWDWVRGWAPGAREDIRFTWISNKWIYIYLYIECGVKKRIIWQKVGLFKLSPSGWNFHIPRRHQSFVRFLKFPLLNACVSFLTVRPKIPLVRICIPHISGLLCIYFVKFIHFRENT